MDHACGQCRLVILFCKVLYVADAAFNLYERYLRDDLYTAAAAKQKQQQHTHR